MLRGIITAVLGLGTLNRVLYRLALVPLKDYVFFLAQAQNVLGTLAVLAGVAVASWPVGGGGSVAAADIEP
eukprot:gene4889-5134_t